MIKQAPFKPTDIGGCQLWLDGADTTSSSMTFSSGRNLSVWKDKSTSANNFNLISGTTTSVADGLQNAVYIPSGAVMRSVNQFTLTTSSAYFIVCKLITIGSGSVQNINDVLQFINIPVSGYIPYIRFYQGVLQGTATPGNPGNTNDIGNGNYFVNGTFNPNFDSSYYLNKYVIIDLVSPNVGGTTFLSISDTSFPRPFLGNIGEIICYPGGVTSTQRLQIESYLAQKWSLREQLPQGHPGTRGIVYPSQPIPTAIYWRYPSPFVPTQIQSGTCQLWLDGSDSSTITGTTAVSAWTDKSGNGNNTTIFGTPNSTFGTINNVKAMWFNGSSGTYGLFSNTGATVSGFVVGTMNSATSTYGRMIALGNNPGNDDSGTLQCPFLLRQVANQAFCTRRFQTDRTYSSYTYDAPFLSSIIYDGTNGNLYVNGSTIVQFGSTGNFGYSNYSVGCGIYSIANNTIDTWTGFVGEVILYRSALTTPQQQQVEGYLAWKWGLQANLPANHPYKNASPNITNPAGISRPANVLPIPPITCTPILKAQFVSSGLVNRWIFNNGSGSTATDTVGGQNISLSGTYTWSSSVPNTAIAVKSLSFDGYSGFGSAAVNATLQTTTYSMSMWYYHTGNSDPRGGNPIIIESGLNQNEAFAIATGGFTGTSKPYFYSSVYNGGFGRTFSSATPLNTWTHLAITIGNSKYNAYQNGVLDSGNTNISITSGLPFTLNGSFIFGKGDNPYGDQFGGSIFDVRIYNRVLTAAEVASIYAGTG